MTQENKGELLIGLQIEGLSLAWTQSPPRQLVTVNIPEDALALYRQAGEHAGYDIEFTRVGSYQRLDSKPGEPLRFVPVPSVVDGYVGVCIVNWDPKRDHTPFWDALHALDPSRTR